MHAILCGVRMKADGERPSLFLFPGSTGDLSQLASLAGHIKLPIAIYGVRPKGSDVGETPLQSIEDMAQYALEEIRLVDEKGPYLLAGFSAGGLVAFEVACRLSSAGESVGLLALLDTKPSERTWPIVCHLEALTMQLMHRFAEARAVPLRAIGPYFRERLRGFRGYMGRQLYRAPVTWQRPASAALPQAEQSLHNATIAARARYLPPYYAGAVYIYFRASEINMEPSNPRRFWGKFVQESRSIVYPALT